MKKLILNVCALCLWTVAANTGLAEETSRSMERLNRGAVAIHLGKPGVYLSWRLLGTDPVGTAFHVYRDGKKLTATPITDSTNYVDAQGQATSRYKVLALVNGKETGGSKEIKPQAHQYRDIPITPPPNATLPDGKTVPYRPHEGAIADLDGDGDYELVLKWEGKAHDVSRDGYTSPVILEALEMDGTSLWRIHLGVNVRAGAHYTQILVFDLDGDGKAEVACRTSDGTVDGKGKVLGEPKKDYRDRRGRVLKAPEYLTVFNGQTGAEIDTVSYEPARGDVKSWGDGYGNRSERHLACVAYLNGTGASIVMGRGYYRARPGRTAIAAWDLRDGKLQQRWKFDTWQKKELTAYIGQGTHSIACGDVDNDGKDEILYGAMAIDDDGSPLYSTNLEHGDAHHLSDLDPSRPGLEFFMPHEGASKGKIPGMSFRDAGTGKVLWSIPVTAKRADIGRGACADIWAGSPGAEAWTSGESNYAPKHALKLFSCKGEAIGPVPRYPTVLPNFFIWWDGDLTREILDRNCIFKYNPKAKDAVDRLLTAEGYTSVNGTKATPVLSADMHGDWREEVIWAAEDDRSLRIYTTVIPTKHRIKTLMHDPIYRLSVAWQNVAYNQPPHPGHPLRELEKRSNP